MTSSLPRRRFVPLLLLACVVATVLPGCGGGDDSGGETPKAGPDAGAKKRIVILTNGPDPYWDTCEQGARVAEDELKLADNGYVLDFQRGEFTDEKQLNALDQYLQDENVVALGISVFNPDNPNVAGKMKELRDKGVMVVTLDGDVNRDKFRDARYGYVGTDNLIGGRELGRAAKALSPDGANFAFFVGSIAAANAVERMQGFLDGAGEGFTEIDRVPDDGNREKAQNNVKDILDNHPQTDMLVGIWAYNTPQAVKVVDARGLKDKVKVVCFDAAEASISAMEDGNVDVMVAQNPYQIGYEGVRLMLAMVEEDQKTVDEFFPDYAQDGDRDIHRTDLRVVVPNGGSPIEKDAFEEETKFFTLDEFEDWLKERGLVSS